MSAESSGGHVLTVVYIHKEMELIMCKMRKCLVTSVLVVLGIFGIISMIKIRRHHIGMYENVGKKVDITLRKSIEVFDKVTAFAKSMLENIKKRK